VHCAEPLLKCRHGKPAQTIIPFDPDEGGERALRDLILASMAFPTSADDDH